jgi:hypothetical protein
MCNNKEKMEILDKAKKQKFRGEREREDRSSVADPGCLSRIPDPIFFHHRSHIRIFPSQIPDPNFSIQIPDPNFSIPDPNFASRIRIFPSGSDFFHPGSASKNFNPKKRFLSSRKYDPGCSSQIRIPDSDFLPIPDPGSRGQKGTRSGIPIRNTGYKVEESGDGKGVGREMRRYIDWS